MTVTRMQVNGRERPLETDTPAPRLSWVITDADESNPTVVSVYRETGNTPIWRIEMPWDAISVTYSGPVLAPTTRYRWTVSASDQVLGESTFGTGIQGEWSAQWISRPAEPWFDSLGELADTRRPSSVPRTWRTMYSSPPLQLRRTFTVHNQPARATLFATARGVYRAYLNGQRAGTDELAPGWTDYRRIIEYQAHDVTGTVRMGENVLAAEVGDGWWSGFVGYNTRSHANQYGSAPEFLAQLLIEYEDGSREVVTTDSTWRELPGEVIAADLLMGEYRDSSLETPGWRSPGYDDTDWRQVMAEPHRGETALVGQRADGIRVVAELAPVQITRHGDAHLVNFGQNITGRVRIRVRGSLPSDVIRIRHGERMDGDALYVDNLRTAEATDILVACGGDQTFEPIFTFHGFQYAEITGLRGDLDPGDVRAIALSSVARPTGSIKAPVPLINRIVSNAWWGQLGNFLAIPTDCPQRDERLGWAADAQVFAATASYNADVHAFLSRWLDELTAAQDATGRVPDVAPIPPTSAMFDDGAPGWGDAVVIVPWTLYRMYGDRELLERNLPYMRAWVDYIDRVNNGELWTRSLGNNYGDWLSVEADTPRRLVAAAFQIHSTSLIANACQALGDVEAGHQYKQRADRLRERFNTEYVSDDGRILGDTQTGYLFALAFDLVPAERRSQVASYLVADVERRGHLTTGFLGVSLLCPTLTEVGRGDLALDLLLQESYPSWGYSIRHGATTMWERWDGWTEHSGFQSITMNSFNHYSFGSVVEWLYRGVAGIDQETDSAGFHRLRVRPLFDARLPRFTATYASVRGEISASWDLGDGWFELRVPRTATARVLIGADEHLVGAGTHHFKLPAAIARESRSAPHTDASRAHPLDPRPTLTQRRAK